ncbi:MAG TPA: hypothetical protein VGI28_09555, partial [Stellaceae bacterium]
MPQKAHWVGTWTTAPAPAEGAALNNHTLRMNARVSIGGDQLRVRLSNAYGQRPLAIGGAHIALRPKEAPYSGTIPGAPYDGAAIVAGSDRKLSFGGAASATIAVGSLLVSDPVDFPLPPLSDVA